MSPENASFRTFVKREAKNMQLPLRESQSGTFSQESVYLPHLGINSTGLYLHIVRRINEGKFGNKTKIANLEIVQRPEPGATGVFADVEGDVYRAFELITQIHEIVSHETSLQRGTTFEGILGEYAGPEWLEFAKRNVDELAAQYSSNMTENAFFALLEAKRQQYYTDETRILSIAQQQFPTFRGRRLVD